MNCPIAIFDTAVLDAEIEAVESERENITKISKTVPPEPVDESFKLAKGSNLKRELIDRGVSKAAAEEMVKAIEPVLPTNMIKAGTQFQVTFDRQYDFYGREVVFPVRLSFEHGTEETIVVELRLGWSLFREINNKTDGSELQNIEVLRRIPK